MPESRQREPREEEREGLFRGKRKPEKMEKGKGVQFVLCFKTKRNWKGCEDVVSHPGCIECA